VRVLRCVLRVESRSAVLAASSLGEAMCEDVMSHCSISAFSGAVYWEGVSIRRVVIVPGQKFVIGPYLCVGKSLAR